MFRYRKGARLRKKEVISTPRKGAIPPKARAATVEVNGVPVSNKILSSAGFKQADLIKHGQSVPGIVDKYRRRPGRPRKDKPKELLLPAGLQHLRQGRITWSDTLGDQIVHAYYVSGGSLVGAARLSGTKYNTLVAWLKTRPEFGAAIAEVDEILKDIVHQRFMERVLDEHERNPSWTTFFLKHRDDRYRDKRTNVKISFDVTDSLIKPTPVEAVDVTPQALPPAPSTHDETGPRHTLDTAPDPAIVP